MIIKIENLNKAFKSQTLFENVNLEISEGKIYGFIGPNGSGKSILFKMICGFIFPNSGQILINGEKVGEKIRFPKDFGIIIDKPGYISNLNGLENLKSLAQIQNKIGEEEIKEAMIKVGLDPNLKSKVKNYSLGMKQKLAIAQTFMENQKVLILDEPFNALDFDSVINIRNLLLELKKNGATILITSHNKEDINYLCDHIFLINNYNLEEVNFTISQ